jgi:plastocyanin
MRSHLGFLGLLVPVASCSGYADPARSDEGSNPPPGASVVRMQEYSFAPSSLTIKAGTTVQWTNNGTLAHTTTSDAAVWDSGSLGAPGTGEYGGGTAGAEYQFRFNSPGTYPYHCTFHVQQGMRGTITVTR